MSDRWPDAQRSGSLSQSGGSMPDRQGGRGNDLADVLERVLDKGVVIAGDISVSLLDIELLTIKLRLLVASADKAREMGIDWWTHDPFLSSQARELTNGNGDAGAFHQRLERMESLLASMRGNALGQGTPQSDPEHQPAPRESGDDNRPA